MDLCWQRMSLLFNILSRLVITFLPRSKYLLVSWLQSPSAVILEPKNSLSLFSLFPHLFAMKRKSAGSSLSLSHSISASSGQSLGGNKAAYWTGRAPTGNKMPIFPSCRDPSLKTDSLGASSLGLEARKCSPPHPKPASFRLILPLNSWGKWGWWHPQLWGFCWPTRGSLYSESGT